MRAVTEATVDLFDSDANGGRICSECDCEPSDDACEHTCSGLNPETGWPCLFVPSHPGKHADIFAEEWS